MGVFVIPTAAEESTLIAKTTDPSAYARDDNFPNTGVPPTA